jgi:patatin-like phospholipase/acyl hydrolase
MQVINWISQGFGIDDTVKTQKEPPVNVLSLSGGGVREIASLSVLAEIENRIGKKTGDIFSLIAATSVGCMTSSMLNLSSKDDPTVRQYSAKDLTVIMEPKIKKVFDLSFLNEVESCYGLYAPKYKPDGMDSVLTELFSDTLAKDLIGHYCFTSYDTNDFKFSYFPFKSRNIRQNPVWHDLKLTDLLRAATAAPTYFSPKKIKDHNLIDGALLENNPSARAYAEAKQIFNCGENMTLLSVGTGLTNFHLQDTNWGSVHWAPWVLPATFAGQDSAARSLADDLLNFEGQPKKFYNVQFDLEVGKDALDDVSDANVEYLKKIAKDWIESPDGDELLREVCLKLEQGIHAP